MHVEPGQQAGDGKDPVHGAGWSGQGKTAAAGDAFCGAFMSRWLSRADLIGAAEYAVRIAAAVVTRFGGRPV
jgi:hypothetical protein